VPKAFRKSSAVSATLHTCAINLLGRLGCWGQNQHGQADVPQGLGRVDGVDWADDTGKGGEDEEGSLAMK